MRPDATSKVLTREEINAMLTLDGKDLWDYDYQLPSTALVFIRPNDEVLMYMVPLKFGLWVKDRKTFQEMEDSKYFPFPLEYQEYETAYDIEVESVKKIHQNIHHYKQKMGDRLNVDFVIGSSDDACYQFLMEARAMYGKNKLSPEEVMAVVALTGEYIRLKINGKWVLREIYNGYNPSYMPLIMDDNRKLIGIYDSVLEVLTNAEIDRSYFDFYMLRTHPFNAHFDTAVQGGMPFKILDE